jgi:hypothetical protein
MGVTYLRRLRNAAFLLAVVGFYFSPIAETSSALACPGNCSSICTSLTRCDTPCGFNCPWVVDCGEYGTCYNPYCGNSICDIDYGEDGESCSDDCNCGDGLCSPQEDEVGNCTQDCGSNQSFDCDPASNSPCTEGYVCNPFSGQCESPYPACVPPANCSGSNPCCPGQQCVIRMYPGETFYRGFCLD